MTRKTIATAEKFGDDVFETFTKALAHEEATQAILYTVKPQHIVWLPRVSTFVGSGIGLLEG